MTISNTSSERARRREVEGVIRKVDAVNRDMTILAAGEHQLVDVPPDCSILLNGESVKLRLLQPGDCVRMTYVYRSNVRTARRIEAGLDRFRNTESSRTRVNGGNDHE